MECSDSGEEKDTSPERNRCCGAHAFFERKVSEQLIAISLVELPNSGESHSEEEGTDSEEREQVAMNSEARKRVSMNSEARKRVATNSEARKRVTTNSEERKRVTMNSEERKRENLSSGEVGGTPVDSDSEEERSWRQLMREEAEYEKHLEEQVEQFEEQSKNWRVKPNRIYDPSYKFHMRPNRISLWSGLMDITQLDQCVEGLIKSHLYTVYTAMQHAHANSDKVPSFIMWLDYDLDKLKLHPNTVKMTMPRMEFGPDGQPSVKDRKLSYLKNGEHNLCLSYATQSLRIHGDEFLEEYGLKMEKGTFSFASRVIRYLLLTYDHSKRQWIMDRLVEPVLVMDKDDLDSEGCGPNFGAVVPQN